MPGVVVQHARDEMQHLAIGASQQQIDPAIAVEIGPGHRVRRASAGPRSPGEAAAAVVVINPGDRRVDRVVRVFARHREIEPAVVVEIPQAAEVQL